MHGDFSFDSSYAFLHLNFKARCYELCSQSCMHGTQRAGHAGTTKARSLDILVGCMLPADLS